MNILRLLPILTLLTLVFTKEFNSDYFKFGEPKITRVSSIPYELFNKTYYLQKVQGNIDLNQIVNIAENTWNFIKSNQASIDFTENYANAVPNGISDWTQLENWHDPVSNCFRVDYTNPFGMRVVSFTYCVLFTPGGDYNGVGQYLNHIQIIPSDINVSWGFKLDAITSVPSVMNTGSSDNPIASAEVHMHYSVTSAVKKDSQESVFYVKGDGSFQQLD